MPLGQNRACGPQEDEEGDGDHEVTKEEHATDALHDGAEHRDGTGVGVAEGQAPEQGVAATDDAQI